MATAFILGGLGLLATGVTTGFAFAGGVEAFQDTKKAVIRATTKRPDTQKGDELDQGDRARNEDKNPFNKTRFLNNIEKREIAKLIKDVPKGPAIDALPDL